MDVSSYSPMFVDQIPIKSNGCFMFFPHFPTIFPKIMGISPHVPPIFPDFPPCFHAFWAPVTTLVSAREPMGIKGSTASAQLRPPEMDWKSVKVEDLILSDWTSVPDLLRKKPIADHFNNHLKKQICLKTYIRNLCFFILSFH